MSQLDPTVSYLSYVTQNICPFLPYDMLTIIPGVLTLLWNDFSSPPQSGLQTKAQHKGGKTGQHFVFCIILYCLNAQYLENLYMVCSFPPP